MALRISLRDGERMVINGAVIRALGRTSLCIDNKANVLRGRDVMTEAEATTPARRLYFTCMLAYIDPEHIAAHREGALARIGELLAALESPRAKAVCIALAQKIATEEFYAALADCRWLITYEAEALARADPASSPVPAPISAMAE